MNISKLLRERTQETVVTERELFSSQPFYKYISKLVEGLTERWTNPPYIELADEGCQGDIAYTNERRIHLNITNSLASAVKGTVRKFKVLLGVLFHEVAHILYLDFEGEGREIARLEKGELPGNGPFPSIEANEVRAALTQPQYVMFFAQLYHQIANFAADNHDEEALITANKWAASKGKQSLVEECVRGTRAVLKSTARSVEEILDGAGGQITVSVMTSLLFQYIRHGTLLVEDMTTMDCEAVKALEPYKADADLIATTDDTMEKFDGITRIILRLWPIIKAQSMPSQNQQGQQGQQSGGQGQSSKESQPQGASGLSQDSQDQNPQNQSGQESQGSSDQEQQGKASQGAQGQNGQDQSPQSGGTPSLDNLLEDIKQSAQGQGESQQPQNRTNSKAVKSKAPSSSQSGDQKPQGYDQQTGGTENNSLSQGQGQDQGQNADQQPRDGSQSQDSGSGETDSGKNGDTAQDNDASALGDRQPSDPSSDGDPSTNASSQSERGELRGEKRKSAEEQMTDAAKQGGDPTPDVSHESMAKERLKQLLNEVREVKAKAGCEKELSQQYALEVKTVNAAGPHSNIPCTVARIGSPSLEAKAMYQTVYEEVKSYSARLQRLVKQELEDRAKGIILRHRAFGRGIDVRDAYRPDQQFFINKKQPDEPPELAVCLLIDLSGSMTTGGRIRAAKRAATMLYDFCLGLHIPCMVCGHNTATEHGALHGARFTVATMFDSVDGNDKYRIMEMECDAGNRDGMAIEIAAGLLSKRQEEHKLLIVLSDGQPADYDYGGQKAVEDIQSIVSKYRRRGVETVGTAIGVDRDRIRHIYGDGYLDIEDLSKLPTTLTKLLKSRFLQK